MQNKKSRDFSVMMKQFPGVVELVRGVTHQYCVERYNKIRTVDEAYESGKVTLAELAELYSPNCPKLMIEAWINQLMIYLNSGTMENYQVKELAGYIYDDNWFLNLAEITLLFTRIKKGYYGQFYGRIDPVEILRWTKEYRRERGMYISKLP